ncbi:MAG: hypothetical protein LBC43_04075 [Bifidobacteriaceae bacterium]|jgi:ABC-type protease/lipase transport system fused ATPase/permease subunit|nr:hypothetical protein [Bifidobacteriaceae bacterium]
MHNNAVLEFNEVSVSGILAPTSFEVHSGEVHVIGGGDHEAKVAIALLLAGRMRTYHGLVAFRNQTLTTNQTKKILQNTTALIDVDEVSAPDPEAKFSNFLKEELEFSGQKPLNSTVHQLLQKYSQGHYLDTMIAEIPKDLYLRLYLEIASTRAKVDTLVLFEPDRYDDYAEAWPGLVEEYHDKGFTVIVILRLQSALAYTNRVIRLGQANPNFGSNVESDNTSIETDSAASISNSSDRDELA